MTKILSLMLTVLAAFAFAACGNKAADNGGGKDGDHKDGDHDHDDHDHEGHGHEHTGDPHDLGTQKVAGYDVKVVQRGDLEMSKEATFEVKVPAGPKQPSETMTVRAWVGTQDGKGSVKVKAPYQDDHHDFDAHIMMPKELPTDAKVWVEFEDGAGAKGTASFAIWKK